MQKTAHTIIKELLSVLHPGAVGLIGNHHGKEALDKACTVIQEAKNLLDTTELKDELPVAVIYIEGGCFVGGVSSQPLKVVVLDNDTEGQFDEDLTEIDGDDYLMRHFDLIGPNENLDGVDAVKVASILQQIEDQAG